MGNKIPVTSCAMPAIPRVNINNDEYSHTYQCSRNGETFTVGYIAVIGNAHLFISIDDENGNESDRSALPSNVIDLMIAFVNSSGTIRWLRRFQEKRQQHLSRTDL